MESQVISRCCSCIFMLSIENKTCVAFIDGIPEDVWLGKISHNSPIKGDKGLRYKEVKR